jgi:hypothetical protein
MSKLIYLEPDEEITDVIDKISKADDGAVSLVIPRGSTLANSVVNLKLLGKRSKKLNKEIFLVTNDKIARNLASQIGLPVFASVNEAKTGVAAKVPEKKMVGEKAESTDVKDNNIEEIDGIRVHKYDKDAEGKSEDAVLEVGEPLVEDDTSSGQEPDVEPEVIEAVRDLEKGDSDELKVERKEMNAKAIKPNDFKLEKKKPERIGIARDVGRPGGSPFGEIRDRKNKRKKRIIIIATTSFIVLVFALYILIPTAKIVIAVVSEPFSSEANINVSKDSNEIDFENSTIPGNFFEKEEELSKTFSSTGEKNVGAKPKGKITVYNNWDQQPISLAAGTTFSSSGGASFVSASAVTVPGAQVGLQDGQFVITASGTADVNVEAIEVGEQGNIGPSDFTITSIPKIQQSKIYGKSANSMSGGTNQMVKVVAKNDISDAKTVTENELKESATKKINEELGKNYKLLESALTFETLSESADRKEGDQADVFNYDLKVKVRALAFSEEDFRNMLVKNAEGQLPDDQEIVSDQVEDINYQVTSSDIASGKIELKGKFEGYIANKYDNDIIKSDTRGKSITAARKKITSYDKVLSVDINTFPRFIHSIPHITRNITVEYNYGKK